MLPKLLESTIWYSVPDIVINLTKQATTTVTSIRDLIPNLPPITQCVYYNPENETVKFRYHPNSSSEKVADWHIALKAIHGIENIEHGESIYLPDQEPYILVKQADTPVTAIGEPIASLAQMKSNWFNRMFGGPNPLAAGIAGALMGSGAGYGAGWLGEQMLPEDLFEKGKLRRTGAMLGAAAGGMPGVLWGVNNWMHGPEHIKGPQAFLSNYGSDAYEGPGTPPVEGHSGLRQKPPVPFGEGKPGGSDNRYKRIHEYIESNLDEDAKEINDLWQKYAAGWWDADPQKTDTGAGFNTPIPVDQFGRVIWNDIDSYGGYTSAPLAAATTGILQAASLSRGGKNYVTPLDIARIGMGAAEGGYSGYLSGMLAGKTLGALAGLRPEAQKTLQQMGTWAGILGNVIPLVLGGK